jgi:DNA-binding Lrp family transcriptional regulator
MRRKNNIFSRLLQDSKPMELDKIDTRILGELAANARVSTVDLSTRIGLSGTAISRRQKALEENGFIRGYQAVLDLGLFGLRTTVLVRIALESQSEQALKAFEAGVLDCPSVITCFLMSGSDDYIAIVLARDIEDFERIHRTELTRLPRVARIQSSFAMREVVNRAVPPVVFGKPNVPKRNRPSRG